jgi:hypothetical protein
MSSSKVIKKYSMNHERRGIALVLNIRNYDAPNPFQLKERVWSERDVENLKKTLEYLEFDFNLLQNLNAEEIKTSVQSLTKYVDHSKSDCFLCVVMSHGSQDKIIARDNQEVSFEEIMEPIKSCPTLINKPKLFFFQSCRGTREMYSSEMINNSRLISDPTTPFYETWTNMIETESDLLVYYSTLSNYASWGNEVSEGTIFVKSVCDVLFNEAYKDLPNNLSLSQMITRINEKIRDNGRRQLGDPRSTLVKEIYFTPKNVSVIICFDS